MDYNLASNNLINNVNIGTNRIEISPTAGRCTVSSLCRIDEVALPNTLVVPTCLHCPVTKIEKNLRCTRSNRRCRTLTDVPYSIKRKVSTDPNSISDQYVL